MTLRDAPLFFLPLYYYTSEGENITESPELLSALQSFAQSTSPDKADRVLSGLPDGADLTVAAGLRAGGWSACDTIEQAAEYRLVLMYAFHAQQAQQVTEPFMIPK